MKNKNYSTIKLCDLQETYKTLGIIKVFINNRLVWDDDWYGDTKPIMDAEKDYQSILNREDIITSITLKVVQFHHFNLYIKTVFPESSAT